MQSAHDTQYKTADGAVEKTGSGSSARPFALSRTLSLAGGIGAVAAVLAFGAWLVLGSVRPWPPDPLRPPAFPTLDWWLTPIERNAFARVPVISGDLAAIVEQPGRGRLWAVGAAGLIVRSDDGGRSWRQVDDVDWSALASPPRQTPATQQQQQQQPQVPSKSLPQQQQVPVPQQKEAPLQREAPAKKSDAGPLDLLLRAATAQESGKESGAAVAPVEPPGDAALLAQALHPRAIAFSADGERAVIVGARGAVLVSEDAGDSWRARPSGVDAALLAVDLAADGQRAVAVGERGVLLLSRDGGDAWTRIDAGTRATLHGVDLDAAGQSAVAVGETSTVLLSRDGGASWQPRLSRRPQDLHAVRLFADARRAVAVGESGTVLVSDDGGNAWDRIDAGSGAELWAVDGSADGERVIAAGVDGTLVLIDGAARSARTVAIGTRAGLAAVHASGDGERLFAAGADGTVLASRDGGRRWHRLSAGAGAFLHAVAIAGQRGRAVAVGNDGRVLVSDDAGERWHPAATGSTVRLESVAISADGQRVIAVGESPRPLLSEDGGAHWREVEVDTQQMLRAVALSADGRRAIAVGLDGMVLLSDDGGASWRRSDTGVTYMLRAVALSRDGRIAVAAGGGAMILSRDGGASWQPREWPPDARMSVSSLQISDDGQQLVAAAQDGAVLRSGDGGASWRVLQSGASALRHVSAIDAASRLVGVGPAGSIVVSPDGGGSWRRVDSGTGVDLAAVAFAPDERRGIAVGHGRILLSDDIGQSWRPVAYARFPAPWTYLAAFALGLVSFIVARASSRAGPAAAPDAGIAALAASDRPIGRGDRDPLDFDSIARGLSRFLRNAGTEPPLTIGVTGEWGTGKSSLMRLLHDDLLTRDFRPVWFNAWHHQKGEQLLASLFEHIRGQGVPPLLSRMGVRYRARLLWQRGRDRWLRYGLLAALFATALVYAVLHGAEVRELLRLVGDTAAQQGWLAAAEALLGNVGLKGAGTLAALLLPVLTALRALRAFGIDAGALMTGAGSGGERRESKLRPGARYVFAREFRDVTRALEPYTMVIFIDDLDRCHKDVVPEVLETVNFLMTSGNCFVVLGMARAWVETCVGLAFEELASEMDNVLEHGDGKQLRRDFARDYLEKLLNVEVPVPAAAEEQSRALLAPEPDREELPRRVRAAVLGTLREVAPAFGLAAVAALGAWLGFALPSLELRPRAPPEIRAEVGTLTLRPPAVLAEGGAQLAIPIERRREPGGGGDTVVLGQVSFEGARGDVAIEFRSSDAAPPAPPEQVARRLVLGRIAAGEHDADLVLRLHAGAAATGTTAATGAAGASPARAPEPEPDASPRRAATVEAGQPASPWPSRVLLVGSVLLVVLIVVVAYTPPGVVERDSPAFLEALRLWHPWIVARRNTPRAIKRYLNRVRYVAMRCKHDPERDEASEDELPEPIAVALTALDVVSVDRSWVRSKAAWHSLVQRDFESLLRTSFPGEPDAQHLRDLAARLREIVDAHTTHQKFQAAERDLFNDAFRARYVRVTGEIRTD